MTARRVLIISFSYAPMLNARAFRWTALAGHLAESGWEVDVVTSWQPGAASEDRAGLRVHRAGWRWAEQLRKRLRQERRQLPAARTGRTSLFARLLQGTRHHVWRHLYWPDASCLWYWPARRVALELVRKRSHDVIISVSPGFTAVMVGQAVLRACPQARWVVDIGDPFSLQVDAAPNNRALYGALNRRAERRALRRAELITVTTPQTSARYAQAFPETASKLQVIPPLLSIPPAEPGAPLFAQDGTIRLVYVGTLYRGLREPQFLLELYKGLSGRRPGVRYELHLYGDTHEFASLLDEWRQRLPGTLHVHGMVARETIARAVEAADLLVNIGNSSSDQLPSKVVEYAASGKPILNLARSPDDSSAFFLESYPDKLTLFDSGKEPSARELELLESFTAHLPRKLAAERVASWLAPYRLPRVAARYEELLA